MSRRRDIAAWAAFIGVVVAAWNIPMFQPAKEAGRGPWLGGGWNVPMFQPKNEMAPGRCLEPN